MWIERQIYVKMDENEYIYERGKFTLPESRSIQNYEATYREVIKAGMKCKVKSAPMFILGSTTVLVIPVPVMTIFSMMIRLFKKYFVDKQ
jgi:hypothetical protein